jgi:peptidoglycan/LPS O-acetylase OafA/YrhL
MTHVNPRQGWDWTLLVAEARVKRFKALDSWRGVAACTVAISHFAVAGPIPHLAMMQPAAAGMCVDFFFVLSGFIICAAYGERIASATDLRKFMTLRLGRVWPLHVAMLSVFVVFQLILFVPMLRRLSLTGPFAGPTYSVHAIVTNFFLVQAMGTEPSMTWNLPGWSISVEFWTYLLFGLLLLITLRRHSLVGSLMAIGGFALMTSTKLNPPGIALPLYNFFRAVAGFGVGVLCFQTFHRLQPLAKRTHERLPAIASVTEVLLTVFVGLYFFHFGSSWGAILSPLLFFWVVLLFAFENGVISRIFCTRPFLILGTLSYSIYMTHYFVEERMANGAVLAGKLFHQDFFTLAPTGRLVGNSPLMGSLLDCAMLPIVFLVAWVTWRFIEEPWRKMFREWADDRPYRAAPSAINRDLEVVEN